MKWVSINESIEHTIDEAKEDNDKTGREFEWKVTKFILEKLGKFTPNIAKDFDPNKYSDGKLVPDEHATSAAETILNTISGITFAKHIGEDNGHSHGDVELTVNGKPIGVELKYVKDGQGTWHNTKGTLLNKYLEDNEFISPMEVMRKFTDSDKYEFGKNKLKFDAMNRPLIEEFKAAIEPFATNGISMSSDTEEGWGDLVSSDVSHAFRHGVNTKEFGKDVPMGKIIIRFDRKLDRWTANGIPLEYSEYWDKNDKHTDFPINSIEVYKSIVSPLGQMTMRHVVSNHINIIKKHPEYINKIYMAMLTKVTSANLTSKLPDYLLAFRKKTGKIKMVDCSIFSGKVVKDAELIESNPKKDNVQAMGYTVKSKSTGISFKIQYYWKNGTGLTNPVIIGFIDF